MVTSDQIRKARINRRLNPTDYKYQMKVTLVKNNKEIDFNNYITDYSIPIKDINYKTQINSTKIAIDPIKDNYSNKYYDNIQMDNDSNIHKEQPKIMTKHAYDLLNRKKHIFMAMLKCGHCNNQKNVINGNLRVPIYDPKSKRLMYQFDNYKKSNKMVKKAIKDIKREYKNKNIKKKDYNKMINDIYHISEVNKAMIDLGYEKIKDNYMAINVDDLTAEDYEPYKNEIKQFNDNMVKIQKERDKLEKLNSKGKISKSNFKSLMKKTYQQKLQLREDLVNKLKHSKNGEKLANYLIANEISEIYGIAAFPSFINDKCTIPQDNDVNVKELIEMGYTQGLLKGCVTSGTKTELQFIDYDAQQRNDMKTLQKIMEAQNQIINGKNKKKSIEQLVKET